MDTAAMVLAPLVDVGDRIDRYTIRRVIHGARDIVVCEVSFEAIILTACFGVWVAFPASRSSSPPRRRSLLVFHGKPPEAYMSVGGKRICPREQHIPCCGDVVVAVRESRFRGIGTTPTPTSHTHTPTMPF
jgi:hypothetical protein